MINRYKSYLDSELKSFQGNREVDDLKDELLSNLVDKYQELIDSGLSEEKAYIESIKSIGDLSEIVERFQQRKTIIQHFESEKRDIDQILYKNKKDEDYVYDHSLDKLKKMNIINLALFCISVVLFYGITLVTYYEFIGFMVQMVILIMSGLLFAIYTQEFSSIIHQLKLFNDKNHYVQGLKYMKKTISIATSLVIVSFCISLPYIIYNVPGYAKAIITFDTYLYHFFVSLLFGFLLYLLLYFLINHVFSGKIVSNQPISFKQENPGFDFFIKHISYLLVVIIIFAVTRGFDFYQVAIILLILLFFYDFIQWIIRRQFSIFCVLRMIVSIGLFEILVYLSNYVFENHYNYEGEIDYWQLVNNRFMFLSLGLSLVTFLMGVIYLLIKTKTGSIDRKRLNRYYIFTIFGEFLGVAILLMGVYSEEFPYNYQFHVYPSNALYGTLLTVLIEITCRTLFILRKPKKIVMKD